MRTRIAKAGLCAWGGAVLMALMLPAPATAQTTRPATTTIAPAPTPRATAMAFAAAIERGDAAAAHALAAPGEDSAKMIDATVALASSLKKLDAAAVARFGEPGRKVARNLLHMVDSIQALAQAQEKINGNTASMQNGGAAATLTLRKIDGRWLVVMPMPAQGLPRTLKLYGLLQTAAATTTAEISAAAHSTPEAAAQRFNARVFAARINAD